MLKVTIIIKVDRARLNRMVGEIMRPVVRVDVESSLKIAAGKLTESGVSLIAVTREEKWVGVLTDHDFSRAFANSADPNSPLGDHMSSGPTVKPYVSAAEGLRTLVDSGQSGLVVLDDDGRPVGLLNSGCFWGIPAERPKPALVGGMATPFGVYLTNGGVSGGAKTYALVLTGAMMFGMFLAGKLAVLAITERIELPSGWVGSAIAVCIELVPLLVLLLGFRLLPISRIHAAEHQVVHAIERDEALLPENVARMPRVHPRCGTNIAVGATLFLGIAETPWIPYPDVRLILAILATLFFWRPIGSFVQKYITTQPARPKDIESAIWAAKELLQNYSVSDRSAPGPFKRIWRSGMLHVMAGSLLAYGVAYLVGLLFGFDLGRV